MNYAIIAAGEGSRLKQEGFTSVKPLVSVGGEYLIERLIRIFCANQAEEISIIINQQSNELEQWLQSRDFGVKVNLIVKSTPSSLHSFWHILHNSTFHECCLTTVDTIFNEEEFAHYINYFRHHTQIDALMACTQYIDDEKPLYIQVDPQDNITAFADDNLSGLSNRVSAGIYCLREKALQTAEQSIAQGVCRMRNYQRALLENKLNVQSYLLGKVIDIDHVTDIAKAEQMLNEYRELNLAHSDDAENRTQQPGTAPKLLLVIERDPQFSPGNQDKDAAILHTTTELLQTAGYKAHYQSEEEFLSQPLCCQAPYPYVLTMARNPRVLGQLMLWKQRGHTIIVNDPHACYQCFRVQQTNTLQEAGVSIPPSIIVDTNHIDFGTAEWLQKGTFWVKRGDFQTIEPIDVIRVNSLSEARSVLTNYHKRGITQAVLMKHIVGDVVKFYGISNDEESNNDDTKDSSNDTTNCHWFHHFYPKVDKFGQPVNTTVKYNSFDLAALQQEVQRAAKALTLDIYGGDAIVDNQGHFYIIDMNDFPSFSICREEAANHIARRFRQLAEKPQASAK
jgi:dTDP-glucose pyrophosphorylase